MLICSPLSRLPVCAPYCEPVKYPDANHWSWFAFKPAEARASPAATLRAISMMLGRSISKKSFELCESYSENQGLKYPMVAVIGLNPVKFRFASYKNWLLWFPSGEPPKSGVTFSVKASYLATKKIRSRRKFTPELRWGNWMVGVGFWKYPP